MTNKETVERNIGLTIDFVNYLMDNPNTAENLPCKFTPPRPRLQRGREIAKLF
jgi:hypothetical protein